MTLFLLAAALAASDLQSPDGRLSVRVSPGSLSYEVMLDGRPLVASSALGLTFSDGSSLGERTQILGVKRRTHRGAWEDPFGNSRRILDRWNEVRLSLRDTGRDFGLAIRAYDDGIAIRYELPSGAFTVTDDRTEFHFPEDGPAWGGEFSPSTEVRYPETRLSQLPPTNACLPVVVRSGSAYVAIAESDLRGWSGIFLRRSSRTTLRAALASRTVGSGPHVSPWRVLMVGRTAADLVASDLIKNLAEPSRLKDTSWIKPGLMAWDPWWTGQNPTLPQYRGLDARGDTAAHKRYIDFAAEMGWPYQLIDWFWYDMGSADPATATKPLPHVDLPELFRYAKAKGVGLFLWVHSKDVDRMGADRLFDTYERWGAAGVKIDFMNSDSQDMVRWYEETLAAAARHHLMVNFHGGYKPTGLARTYPNYVAQEAVLGNEYNKLPGERFDPRQMITLPFTRGLLGPADVTPGGFVNRSVAEFHTNAIPTQTMGTRCRQLALAVLMTSPLTCLCDSPENYRNQPGLEFFRGLPTVWDETRVLHAEFARSLVIARRKGADWWIAAMNDSAPLSLTVPLTILGKGHYQVESFADGDGPPDVVTKVQTVSSKDLLSVPMTGAGGYVARIRRAGQ
jgi:alpha-glucosidase